MEIDQAGESGTHLNELDPIREIPNQIRHRFQRLTLKFGIQPSSTNQLLVLQVLHLSSPSTKSPEHISVNIAPTVTSIET